MNWLLSIAIGLWLTTLAVGWRERVRLSRELLDANRARQAAAALATAQNERERFGKDLALALQQASGLDGFGSTLLARLAHRIEAKAAALHVLDDEGREYRLAASYARGASPAFEPGYRVGEGIAGQAGIDRRPQVRVVQDSDWLRIGSATLEAAASAIIVAPVTSGEKVPAILEFALGHPAAPEALALIEETVPIVSLSLEALLAKQDTITQFERARAMEARQREILSNVGEGIFGQDLEGRVSFVNAAALRMLGFDESELIGQPMHALTHHHYPDGREFPREECPVYRCTRDGLSRTVTDQVFWRKDGQPLPVEYTTTAITRDGQPEGAVISFRDMTETRRHQREMRERDRRIAENDAKLRTIFETGTEGIWFIDRETRTTDLNPAMERILGRTREEVIGRPILDFVDAENAGIFRRQMQLRRQGRTGAYEIALSRPDGSHVPCLFNAAPMLDENGERIGSFAMVADLSAHRLPSPRP